MKLHEKAVGSRLYDSHTDKFYRNGNGFTMYESPVDIYGPIKITGYFYNDPHARDYTSKLLGVQIEPIKDIAHRLFLPDGRQCKANWFDENAIFLCDKEHATAVCLQWVRDSHRGIIYPSPKARPVPLVTFSVRPPDIRRGNEILKWVEPYVGEARLRAGIIGNVSEQYLHTKFIDSLVNRLPPDMTDPRNVGMLLNGHLKDSIRKAAREKVTVQELRYEP